MKLEEIIEDLNNYLQDSISLSSKGHFVLLKQITPNEKFKAYKEFLYTLWYIEGKKKTNVILFREVQRAILGDDKIIENIDHKFIKELFKFIRSKNFNKILNGEFNKI